MSNPASHEADGTLPSATAILGRAAQHQRERAKAYDQPGGERSAGRIAAAFNAITGRTGERAISEAEAWLFLQVLKQVRLFSAPGYHADSAEDNVSYGSLLAEAKAREAIDQLSRGT
ncbi:hypothetical protein [Geminicoccus flavidas]|uniref:hypothetical protein n=1 Tax=Geminicoccus flavidas TaxID=2506407 RepID=UPI00190FA15A|nr:hypothetical protein [Geminicoccus flavidas]